MCLAHSGDSDDADHLSELADLGYLLGMDRFGVDLYLPFEERVAIVAELIRPRVRRTDGARARCVVLSSTGSSRRLLDAAPNWNFLHISKDVLPALRELGVAEAQIDTAAHRQPPHLVRDPANPR